MRNRLYQTNVKIKNKIKQINQTHYLECTIKM